MADTARSLVFAPGLLSGRVALVTGGGTGLGKATAIELARCGATVVIAGRRAEVLEAAVAEIGATVGRDGTADLVAGDVREPEDARRLIETVFERYGRLDALINNAGGQYFTPAESIVAKGWSAVWRLNVEGVLNMATAAVEVGMGRSVEVGTATAAEPGESTNTSPDTSGTIVNVTLSPHHGMPGMAHSGAARATVEALTRELAARWMDRKIAVTAVAAGHFDTEAMTKYPDTVRAGMARSVPLQRLGRPEEHAWLIALLCSPLGRALNGSTITLDGARDNWFGPWPPPGLTGAAGEVPTEARKGVRAVG
ncbi:MAG: SDR family oxidoreductase [Solirubrobacteraceae bacterium]